MIPPTATVARVQTDMSLRWAQANPALAGERLLRFFEEHPPEEWTLTIRRAVMPGMHLTLQAVRKDAEPQT